MPVEIKRIYEKEARDNDGVRVLVDRVWPRKRVKRGCKIGSLDERSRTIQ
nr:DUF488 family protein [Virgibacillus natechei]